MRSHQKDVAALEQWKPLIHKMAFKAAQRAAGIGVAMSQDDFVQEISIVVLRCQDAFKPEMGVKMITFLYRAIYNELNKIFDRECAGRRVDIKSTNVLDEEGQPVPMLGLDGKPQRDTAGRIIYQQTHKKIIGFNVSGDTTWSGEDGDASAWDYVEDTEASPERTFMDMELMDWVHSKVDQEASAVLTILQSGNAFVTQQLHAYNAGIANEAASGGIKRVPLDMNFAFVAKLLGHSPTKQAKLAGQIKQAVALYGA